MDKQKKSQYLPWQCNPAHDKDMREVSEDNLFPNGEASEMYIVYYVIQPSVPGERGVLSTMGGSN